MTLRQKITAFLDRTWEQEFGEQAAGVVALVREHLLSDEAVDAGAREIDAYVPFTAGAYGPMGDAFRDALSAALREEGDPR